MDKNDQNAPQSRILYRREYEHDASGVGMVANLSGEASHDIVEKGMTVLKRLMHRGATGNDPETGDGAGLLMKIPHAFFRKVLAGRTDRLRTSIPEVGSLKSEVECNSGGPFGVAMIFGGEGEEVKIEAAVKGEGCEIIGWRDVPVNPDAIGRDARAAMPRIRQLFISESLTGFTRLTGLSESTNPVNPVNPVQKDFELKLYIIRRQIEKTTKSTYVCSCSSRTIVYKGLLLATQIEKFYPDLSDLDFVSPFAIVHQRYSTNTFPSWELAHPFRAIAHNGEINAIKGNLNALAAREASLASPVFGDELSKVLPIAHAGQSDSASLDNIFELLVAAGRDAPHAMMMLVPQAWGAKYHMGRDVRAFYEYHSALMEPWDGPAAVAFTDGIGLGAALDRNGLRPARWTLTKDGLFVLASETGVLDIAPGDVERHGRLKPGSLLWLDLEKHRLVEDTELKTHYARRLPYRRWVEENHIPVTGLFAQIVPSCPDGRTASEQSRFGWTLEDIEMIIRPMAETGHEPVGAMGNDAALACLRENRRFCLFDHFHQLFAQVTNPPIDPIREELVMSIMTYIGNEGNILAETPGHARLVKMTRPVLTDDELSRLKSIPGFPAKTLSLYAMEEGRGKREERWLKAALDKLAADALAAVREGAKIIILSDKRNVSLTGLTGLTRLENEDNPVNLVNPVKTIPSLLAVAAVNRALVESGARPSVGIIVESGEVREVHHFAVLLGFGATAINPYLALATVADIAERATIAPHQATANYVSAVCKGLMKIMSKMGISTLRSYRSARIFEAVGLGPKIVAEYFSGVTSPVGGLELENIENVANVEMLPIDNATVANWKLRIGTGNIGNTGNISLPPGGEYRLRKGGKEHLWTPQRVVDFREAVRHDDYARFHRYTDDIDSNSRVTLRSQLEFVNVANVKILPIANANDQLRTRHSLRSACSLPHGSRTPARGGYGNIGTDNNCTMATFVEPVDSIVKHFVGGAMSLGSLSPEAHETIALALNGLGTMSNCGEGGEDPTRFGTAKNSAVKQIASGRFGVTIEYIRSAKDLQIKLAQGAKPGEGGQLPGHKVNELVARLRHAKPGTTLISPPPHHDIYSIEDLAQLIYDLKCANPAARVSVKLVSEAGVGTIAAGVAKAHADVIVISGFDGGTGAAPLASMKHAGLPWELGLAEAHQTLVKNNLRSRVKLQVDGQLLTGRDIVIAAMLGADEFAFGTSMLVSLGCVQCRNCNLNTCPVGIATQKKELRTKFAGRPEHLQRYFRFLAEEVREHLSAIGLQSLAEARGRVDLLKAKDGVRFDFEEILARTSDLGLLTSVAEVGSQKSEVSWLKSYDSSELIPAVERGETYIERTISNCDRSVGAALSGWLVEQRNTSQPAIGISGDGRSVIVGSGDGRSVIGQFSGVAGQSFGAFLAKGVTFNLRGEANDYVGKSLSGGVITIRPADNAAFKPEDNVIAGNVIAYGATSGAVFINGQAGERFGIRNSGAVLVVEGIGDHGCEYMTGGVAVVLGPTGVNFGAGMTGGVAYVLDESGDFDLRCNLSSIDLETVEPGSEDEKALHGLICEHVLKTGSPAGRRILGDWESVRPRFVKVVPASDRPLTA